MPRAKGCPDQIFDPEGYQVTLNKRSVRVQKSTLRLTQCDNGIQTSSMSVKN